jgi:hypothetical protein
MGTLSITLAALVALLLLWAVTRLRQRQELETIDIEVMGPVEDLAQRERIRTLVAGLNLGSVNSLQNAKTGEQFMHVWLHVPSAAAALPGVERALVGEPVRIKVLGLPLDMSFSAMFRRSLPALKEGLLKNWRDSGGR